MRQIVEQPVVDHEPLALLARDLARRQPRLVEAWAELYQDELLANWRRILLRSVTALGDSGLAM